jgi:hypothetical protein
MKFIHRNPFGKEIDPLELMMGAVTAEADRIGEPLSQEEMDLLKSNWRKDRVVPEGLRVRAYMLARTILERERNVGQTTPSRSFGSAIGWAGFDEYPLIVEIAESVVRNAPYLGPYGYLAPIRKSSEWRDLASLLGCACLVVLIFFAVIFLLAYLGVLK